MNEPTQLNSDDEWGASEALVLEGLSGLDNSLVGTTDKCATTTTSSINNKEEVRLDSSFDLTPSPLAPTLAMAGFRSARELRAAQERTAAQQRSATRRRDGITQSLGLTPPIENRHPTSEPVASPKAPMEAIIKRRPASSSSTSASSAPAKPAKQVLPSSQRPQPTPISRTPKQAVVESSPKKEQHRRTPVRPQTERKTDPRSTDELHSSRSEVDQEARIVSPRMESAVRRRRTASSFIPALLTPLLLTSLVWAALIFAFWKFAGKELASTMIQDETETLWAGLNVELTSLENEMRFLKEDVKIDRENNEKFKRMSALEAGIYKDNSRQKFDDIIDIGKTLDTGSVEEEFYQRTKERVELAYTKRLGQHQGLNVGALFPSLGISRERSLSKTTLMNFTAKPEVSGWDRARATFLLRRFKEDDQVTAFLLQTIRNEDDLQVMFASWESLIAISGYEPGSKGFSPSDFDRWWSTR
ncbi:MAG: hypothetical protein ACI957_005290 [Verrucomicrobiales bacterium]|jgi:hypothetical protein